MHAGQTEYRSLADLDAERIARRVGGQTKLERVVQSPFVRMALEARLPAKDLTVRR